MAGTALAAVALEGDRAVGGRAAELLAKDAGDLHGAGGEAAYDEGPLHELEALGVEQDHPPVALGHAAGGEAAQVGVDPAVVTGEATSCRYVGLGAIDGHQTVRDLDTLVSYDLRRPAHGPSGGMGTAVSVASCGRRGGGPPLGYQVQSVTSAGLSAALKQWRDD